MVFIDNDLKDKLRQNQSRVCTDVYCLVLFVLLNLGLLTASIYSFAQKYPDELVTPYDPDYKRCGIDLPQYPYIYFVNPKKQYLYRHVCVSECPVEGQDKLKCSPNSLVPSCQAKQSSNQSQIIVLYPTKPQETFHVCMPSNHLIMQLMFNAIQVQSHTIDNIALSRWVIFGSLGIALTLGIIYLFLMRYCLNLIIWVLIVSFFLCALIFGVVLISLGIGWDNALIRYILDSEFYKKTKEHVGHDSLNILTIMTGTLIILIGITSMICACYNRKKIKLALGIMKAVSWLVSDICKLFLVPFILFLFTFFLINFQAFLFIGIYSYGQISHQEKHLPFASFKHSVPVIGLLGISVFYFIWSVLWINEIGIFVQQGQFIIQGTAAEWYFAIYSQYQNCYSNTIKRLFKFHLGSVSLGSFLTIFLGILKIIVRFVMPRKQSSFNCCYRCLSYSCFLCIKITSCYSQQAYSMINLTGQNFSSSSELVDEIYQRSKIGVTVQRLISVIRFDQIFICTGYMFIAFGTTAISGIIIQEVQPYKTNIIKKYVPIIICGVLALIISMYFVQVYSNAADSILTIYLAQAQIGGKTGPIVLQEFIKIAEQYQQRYSQNNALQIPQIQEEGKQNFNQNIQQ